MSQYIEFFCGECGWSMEYRDAVLYCRRCRQFHPEHPESQRQAALAAAAKAAPTATIPFRAPATLETPRDPATLAIEKTLDALTTTTPKKK